MTNYSVPAAYVVVAAVVTPSVLAGKDCGLAWHSKTRIHAVYLLATQFTVPLAKEFVKLHKLIIFNVRKVRSIVIIGAFRVGTRDALPSFIQFKGVQKAAPRSPP